MKKDFIKWLEITVIVLFALSLVPLLFVSFYSHPLFDDYSYSQGVHKELLREGANLLSVLKVSFMQVYKTYYDWQGCFSATFLATFQPGVYRVPIYWLTAFILIGSLIVSHCTLYKGVICNLLGGKKEIAVIAALLTLEYQIQFVPYIKEAYYWYNGGMAYTFLYSLMVFELALIVRLFSTERKCVGLIISTLFMAAFLGGGNYATALVNVVLLAVALLSAIMKRQRLATMSVVLLTSLLSFGLSVMAPGNSSRATNYQKLSALTAIIESLKYAFTCILRWTRLPQLGLAIILVVLFYQVLKESSFRFRFPFIFIAFVIGLFAAQSTPSLYATSSVGGLRQINMYHYSYYLVLVAIVFYLEGWILGKIKDKYKKELVLAKLKVPALVVAIILIVAGTIMQGVRYTAFCTTFLDLKSGRAQRYDAEYKRIVELIENSEGPVYTTDINEWPDSFYRLDLRPEDDIGYWINTSMAEYFDVPAIILVE